MRRIIGGVLIGVSLASIIQSIRELMLWQSSSRYEEQHLLERPFTFAGHTFTLEDSQPYVPPAPGAYTSEAGSPGKVRLLMNGQELSPTAHAIVRRGRNDLGRYHLWFDATIFRDRRSGEETLWLARRIQERESDSPRFEVITVGRNGETERRQFRAFQLGTNYPVFRSTQFLRGSSFWAVPLSVLDGFIFPPFLLVFPLGTLLVGVWLVRRRSDNSAVGVR